MKGKERDVSKAQLPRGRQPPKRIDRGQSDANFPRTEQDYYRSIYFEALDLLGSGIKSRIDKPEYKNHTNLEKLLHKTTSGDDFSSELRLSICSVNGSDANRELILET